MTNPLITYVLLIAICSASIGGPVEKSAEAVEPAEAAVEMEEALDMTSEEDASEEPDAAVVASGTCRDSLSWSLDEEGTLTLSGYGEMNDYEKGAAPWSGQSVEHVEIEEGVASIGQNAFYGCTELQSVNMSDSVTSIEAFAFCGCTSLRSVYLSEQLALIGKGAFKNCDRLESIELPQTLKNIEGEAFIGCGSLEELFIPSDARFDPHEKPFDLNSTAISISPDNVSCVSIDGVLYDGDVCTLLQYPAEKTDASFTIPDSVSHVYAFAFQENDYLRDLTLGRSVSVFDGVGSISHDPDRTRMQHLICRNLKNVYVSEDSLSFRSIDGVLFDATGTTLIYYPYGRTQEKYVVPDGVKAIGDFSFFACQLTDVVLPDSVETIGALSFAWIHGLSSVRFPRNLRRIEELAFWECDDLQSAVLFPDVEYIGRDAFGWCYQMEATILGKYTDFGPNQSLCYVFDPGIIRCLEGSTAERLAIGESIPYTPLTQEEAEKLIEEYE